MPKQNKSIIHPSTLSLIEEARKTPGYTWVDFIHGYIYGRWTHFYVSLGMRENPYTRFFGPALNAAYKIFTFFEVRLHPYFNREAIHREKVTFVETYHGKVVTLDGAKQLVSIKEDIHLKDLEKVIPYAQARDIVLQAPERIVVMECPCRANRPHPCLPMDVCLVVGDPFASFVHDHQPDKSRFITQEEALEIIRAEDERGHIHHAFFKDAVFGRFYAICNCCSCCCGAIQMQRSGEPMLASSGYVAVVDDEQCIGCATCLEYCTFAALSITDDCLKIDVEKCMGCGICTSICPQGALTLRREPARGEPLEICELVKTYGETSA